MTAAYTAVEIIQGGINDTRETFAHLYTQLAELRERVAYLYHLAFVDPAPGDGRLPFHPAPAGFGGNELAALPRPIRTDMLTPAGLALYAHGVRTGEQERAQLLREIDKVVYDLDRMNIAATGDTHRIVHSTLHALDVTRHRNAEPAIAPVTAWDVPVRIPGTRTTIPPRA